ncbi:hypothetical protein [Paucibacter sp. B2R-40]|jgi:hypothetical protein|nr:hypothetical protein [Paucibacter sp. B2R-40]
MSAPARWGLRLAALLLLGAVFLSYFRADLMVQLSEQIWACF